MNATTLKRFDLAAGTQYAARSGPFSWTRRYGALWFSLGLAACGEGGAMIEARPQTIAFGSVPVSPVSDVTATVSATATSGLAVRYNSLTPSVCSVEGEAGVVTAFSPGSCTIAADQPGDNRFAPAARVTETIVFAFAVGFAFAPAPALRVFDIATVLAHGSVTPPSYATSTPSVCSVEPSTGRVLGLSPGICRVAATADEALQADLSLPISPPDAPTVPSAVTGVVASMGADPASVIVRVGGTRSGGAPITEYFVRSVPDGITASGQTSPIVVACPFSCNGFAFTVSAANAIGTGPASPPADVITSYGVQVVFHEPETKPNDSLFVGSFAFDATTRTVSDLRGRLSESMTGGPTAYPNDTMTWLPLSHQLSSLPVEFEDIEGLFVTSFLWDRTDTLSNDPTFDGTDGWSPGTGMGLYYGYPGDNPGNAYVRIFVNTADPLAPIPPDAIAKLAYADCAPGGMMGATCMTGTSVAGYGSIGTMSGYPLSQQVTQE